MPDPNPERQITQVHIPRTQSDDFRQRMRLVQEQLGGSGAALSQTAAAWAKTLLVVALSLFAFFTLFPFNFSLHTGQHFTYHLYDPTDPSDWVMNILLTVPLGFALATLAAGKGWHRPVWKMLVLAGVVSCLSSTTVECLQLFLPSRVSALADILSNTTGGLVGGLCFVPFGRDVLHFVNYVARSMRRSVIGLRGAVMYVMVIILVCATLACLLRRPRLAYWNPDFPLLLGNENNATGVNGRGWNGAVSSLQIASRAATAQTAKSLLAHGDFASIMGDSVVADYSLLGPGPYPDASHHLHDLIWDRPIERVSRFAPAYFADGNFLSTQIRTGPLVNAIVASDCFTIALFASADSAHQTGPARILSCSKNIYGRNFTIGQDNADLIIRIRTRTSGDNGTCPEWRVPGVFRDHDPHLLLITYDGSVLGVYVDTPARYWRVRTPPEYSVLRPILARDLLTMSITGVGNRRLVVLFYTVFMLPIALVLGTFVASAVPPASADTLPEIGKRMILPAIGLLFAAAGIYVTVDRLGVRAIGWTECPLAALILAIETAIFGHWWAHGPARRHADTPMARVTFIGDAPKVIG